MNKDWAELLDVMVRSVFALSFLFFLTKMLGKKQVSQLSIFDYVIGISIGSIAAEMTINNKIDYIHGLTAMVEFAAIAYIISLIGLKSVKLRRFFTGTPVILIEDGKILRSGLRKSLIDVNDLLAECRNAGYFDISEIEYAIMETSGKISFLPKSEYDFVKPDDLNIKPSYKGLIANLVMDGKIMRENLNNSHKTEYWLLNELKKQGYDNLENIFLVTYDSHGHKLKVYEKVNEKDTKTYLE